MALTGDTFAGIPGPPGQWARSGVIFGFHTVVWYWHRAGRGQGCTKHCSRPGQPTCHVSRAEGETRHARGSSIPPAEVTSLRPGSVCQARPGREAAFLRGALGPAFQVHLPRPVRPERSPSESRRHARRLRRPTWHLPSGAWGPGGSGLPRCWGSTRTSHEAPRPPCPLSPPGGAGRR